MIQKRAISHNIIHQPDLFRNGIQYLQEPLGGIAVWNGQFEQPGFDRATNSGGWEPHPADANSVLERVTGGLAGNWCFKGYNTVINKRGGYLLSLCYIPVDETRDYCLSGSFKGSTATATVSFGCACYDAAKAFLAYTEVLTDIAPGAAWVNYDYAIGPMGAAAWAAGTRYVRVYVYLQHSLTEAANAYMLADNIFFDAITCGSPQDTFNVLDYGAKGDGKTDDTVAIKAAINALPATGGAVCFPAGMYLITDTLTLTHGIRLTGSNDSGSVIVVGMADVAIDITELRCGVDNLSIIAAAGFEQTYTGIQMVASYHSIRDVTIYEPLIGMIVEGNAFFCVFDGIFICYAEEKGIWLRSKVIGGLTEVPQNNTFIIKEILGHSAAAGSIGIYIDNAMSNAFIGGTVDFFETGVQIDVGTATQENTNNKFETLWVENNTTGITAAEGVNYFDGILIDKANATGDAEIRTPTNGFERYYDVSYPRPSTEGLMALYLFNEGTGTNILDYSGNSRDATAAGTGGTWVSGLHSMALQFDNVANSEYLSMPTTVVDPTVPYTVALLWHPDTLMVNNNVLFQLDAAAGHLNRWYTSGGAVNTNVYLMQTSLTAATGFGAMRHTDVPRWCWLLFTYNPTTGVCTSLDPTFPGGTVTHANDVAAVTAASIHINWSANHFIATYQLCAIWQRVLTVAEITQFVNSAHMLTWMATIANA